MTETVSYGKLKIRAEQNKKYICAKSDGQIVFKVSTEFPFCLLCGCRGFPFCLLWVVGDSPFVYFGLSGNSPFVYFGVVGDSPLVVSGYLIGKKEVG